MGEKYFYLGERKGERTMDDVRLSSRQGQRRETSLIQEQLSRVEHFQIVADVFRQLDDTTRIRIFWLLCHCEECVLRPLKNSGLVVSRRVGKEVYYRAADTEESRLLHQMIEQVMEITCPDL